ncbi:MAG: alpha/beta hydrolase [Saprospiraceae bacterium]
MKGNESLGTVEKPSLYLFLTEIPRAIGAFIKGYGYYLNKPKVSATKGSPVLVLPGFLGSDLSTSVLRKYLKKSGYHAYGWGLGRNLANLKDLKKIDKIINQLYTKYENPVVLIGWSLGGVYARHITKHKPDKVAQLITMGSPYMGVAESNRAHLTFKLVKMGRGFNTFERKWIESLPQPVEVPSTAIYSKNDGIVSWKVCHEATISNNHQNIEVTCGHFGMGVCEQVFKALDSILERE